MIIHKCDSCGNEFENGFWDNNKVIISGLITNEYELCNKCMNELKSFFKFNENKLTQKTCKK